MTSKISTILEVLSDGKWRTLEEIQQKTGTGEKQIQRIVEFLQQYDFIEMDQTKRKIKLDETFKEFLT